MRAKAMYSTDAWHETVTLHDDMGLKLPDINDDPDYYYWDDVYFDIEKVYMFNRDGKGNITIRFAHDDSWTFQYSNDLWNKLIERYG